VQQIDACVGEKKEALAAENQLRAEMKKSHQGKKQFAIPRLKRQKNASVQSIELYVLTDTGQILLLKELPLTDNFLDEV
jgi:hypothetical protein